MQADRPCKQAGWNYLSKYERSENVKIFEFVAKWKPEKKSVQRIENI